MSARRRCCSTTAVYLLRLADVLVHSLLVAPVCGHAVLGDPVHLSRPDLDLHGHAVSAQHHRVQRLVPVLLLVPDVILEAPLNRRPQPMHLREAWKTSSTQ